MARTMNVAPEIAGCTIMLLDPSACEQYLGWLVSDEAQSVPDNAGALDLAWVLAHSESGVTWGRYDGEENRWRLGDEVAPDEISPSLRRDTLLEVRVFGEGGEVLIWRSGSELRGRVLADDIQGQAGSGDEPDPLKPSCEYRLLRCRHLKRALDHGFGHMATGTGAEQVIPLIVSGGSRNPVQEQDWPRLGVRHYYERDRETGAVRVVATRLAKLIAGGSQ